MKKQVKKPEVKKVKKSINVKALVRRFVARPLAYLAVFILASYGLRQLLHNINDTANVVLTTLVILALTYIIFLDD